MFLKQPTDIEFVQIVEKESRYQAQKLDFIRSGKIREEERDDVWVPEIPSSYIRYRDEFFNESSGTTLTTDKEKKPKKTKKMNKKEESQETMEDMKWPVMANINDNSGHPRRTTKRPKKSL
jgi:hypothetical protein